MFIDWTHWLLSIHPDELALLLLPLLLLDAPRYALGVAVLWLWDYLIELFTWARGGAPPHPYTECPSVCVVVAGLNEADTISYTLESLWGTYPRMEVVIVDDGSQDGMSDVAQRFAEGKRGITILRKPNRGGKSSALNFALPFTQAEIIVCVDGDSHLKESAIWEVVQPFRDPRVAAVSASVTARNPFVNLTTWLQAMEYLRNIFLGRMLTSRLGILGIVSGAFGAYRRSALQQIAGWDVGPGEDGDLSLRLRKAGYRVVFAPYAQCLTNLPTSFWRLIKQRRRWEWAIVTFECRKHIDLGNIFSPNFRLSNLMLLLDRWIYGLLLPIFFWAYLIWLCAHPHANLIHLFILYYVCYLGLELLQVRLVAYYSMDRKHDLIVCLIVPLMPFYHLIQRCVSSYAVVEELLWRRSFKDSFVPAHVRRVTWHW